MQSENVVNAKPKTLLESAVNQSELEAAGYLHLTQKRAKIWCVTSCLYRPANDPQIGLQNDP